jgi:tubulin monoglycylase TTLL15
MLGEFKEFVVKNPEKKFVRKSDTNRGVYIVSTNEIDFENQNDQIYQEFIENPFLVDGHAFDLGVYVLVTSINPLRVYRFQDDAFLRFCPEQYHPFDPKNVDKYVVYETQKTIDQIPSLRSAVVEQKMSFKASFEWYLKTRGFSKSNLWSQIDNIVVTMFLSNEENLMESMSEESKIENFDNFFELLRFDFLIDDDFIVHLMEINLSPNLTPASERFEIHAPLYEKVIHDSLELVMGIEHGSR